MVDYNFTLVSGVYQDEQDLLFELDLFLTQTIQGWTQVKVVTDTASDKDIAYYSDGSAPGVYDRLWIRLRATGDELRPLASSNFLTATDTSSDPLGDAGDFTEMTTGTSSGIYWFAANKDAVHVVVDHLDGNTRHGGFGLWSTCYTALEDPKPFYVFGQTAQNQTFASALRLQSYGPHSWGLTIDTTNSGTVRPYEASHPIEIANGTTNPRTGELKLVEPVFYTDSNFLYHEVRGEVPGLYMCGGENLTHGQLIEINDTLGTISGTYFIHRHTDALSWAIGPVIV